MFTDVILSKKSGTTAVYVTEDVFLKIRTCIELKTYMISSLCVGNEGISISFFVLFTILHDFHTRAHLRFIVRKTKARHLHSHSIHHASPFPPLAALLFP